VNVYRFLLSPTCFTFCLAVQCTNIYCRYCIVGSNSRDVCYRGRMTDTLQSHAPLQPKRVPISYDYRLSSSVLGLGINGKVLECYSKATGQKYALKASID